MSDSCPGCGGEIVGKMTEYGGQYRGCENCAYNEDKENLNTPVLEQLEAVRRSGLINMLNTTMVQRIAFECEYHSLVRYIDESEAKELMSAGAEAREKYEGEELSVPVPESIEYSVTIN